MADKNPDAPAIIEEDRIVRYSQPDKMIELKRITALPTLMHWRAEVIRNVSGVEPHPRMLVANRQYYRKHIADDTHLAFVAEYDGVECGCGAVCFTEELPSPKNPFPSKPLLTPTPPHPTFFPFGKALPRPIFHRM